MVKQTSVCVHPPTHQPGILFLSGDEQATISGWGQAPLFTSASAGMGWEQKAAHSAGASWPLQVQWILCPAQEVQEGQCFQSGMQTGLGEALCVCMGLAF